jgi:hypothetical protein
MTTRHVAARGAALPLAVSAALLAGSACSGGSTERPAAEPAKTAAPDSITVKAVPFPERNEKQGDVYNVSGIVPLEDGRFLLVDNNTNDALLELRLSADGRQAAPLRLLPLQGLPEDTVDDIEDLALAEEGGRRFVFATPSFSVKAGSKKKGKEQKVRPSGLLRVEILADGTLRTEIMTSFRAWLVRTVPEIAVAADNDPEFGGLNVEGVAWDPERHAVLLGVRTPVLGRAPFLVPVRIKALAGPWDETNLEALPLIRLEVERTVGDQGVRGMSAGPGGKGFLVSVANATSEDQAGFSIYSWDGNQEGGVRRLPFVFAGKMKPEGLTVGTVGGRPAIVFADDAGGFQVVWLDSVPALAG